MNVRRTPAFAGMAVALALLAVPAGAEPPPWYAALAPYLTRVDTEHAGTAAAQAQAQARRAAARADTALPDPTLQVSVQSLPTNFDFDQANMTQAPLVSLRQQLPSLRQRRARRRAVGADADVHQAEAFETAEAAALTLAVAIFLEQQLRMEVEAVTAIRRWFTLLLESAQSDYRGGGGGGHDVAQIRVERAQLADELDRLQADLATARSRWRQILNVHATRLPVLPVTSAWQPSGIAVTTDVTTAPTVAIQRAQQAAAAQRIQAAKRSFGPDFGIEIGYGARHGDRRDFLTGRFAVSLPVWARQSQKPRIAAARRNEAAAEFARLDAERRTRARREALLVRHEQTTTRQRRYQSEILTAAETARRAAHDAYAAGEHDIFAVIDATRRALQVERDFARVVAERRRIEAELLALAGRLHKPAPHWKEAAQHARP